MATPTPAESQPASEAGSAGAEPVGGRHREHRFLVATLFTVAFITGLLAVFSVWVNRQALNTDNWTATSGRLLQDPNIQQAVGAYLVDQLFRQVDVEGEIQGLLPSGISGLAGPATAGLRQVADQVAPELLARPRIQAAWEQANRVAHKELLSILNGGNRVVSTRNGEVTLDLNTLVSQLAAGIGVQAQVATVQSKLQGSSGTAVRSAAQQKLGITLPATTGQLVILRSSQLKTAQDIASAIRGLALWLTIITLALLVAAVWVAAGWRRIALRTAGWCLVGIGVVVVLLRRVVGNRVIDPLVTSDSVRPAAHDAWLIGTSLLYDIALALIVYGVVIVVAAWLAGGTRPAAGLRRALAPELREHPARVYAAAGFVYLLLLVWGPTPAFRQLVPIIGMVVLIVLGLERLRRQTAVEFPDAELGDATHRLRAWVSERRYRLRHGHEEAANGSLGAPGFDGADRLARLERAAALHDRGVLTDAEFLAEKSAIMGGS